MSSPLLALLLSSPYTLRGLDLQLLGLPVYTRDVRNMYARISRYPILPIIKKERIRILSSLNQTRDTPRKHNIDFLIVSQRPKEQLVSEK